MNLILRNYLVASPPLLILLSLFLGSLPLPSANLSFSLVISSIKTNKKKKNPHPNPTARDRLLHHTVHKPTPSPSLPSSRRTPLATTPRLRPSRRELAPATTTPAFPSSPALEARPATTAGRRLAGTPPAGALLRSLPRRFSLPIPKIAAITDTPATSPVRLAVHGLHNRPSRLRPTPLEDANSPVLSGPGNYLHCSAPSSPGTNSFRLLSAKIRTPGTPANGSTCGIRLTWCRTTTVASTTPIDADCGLLRRLWPPPPTVASST